MKKLIVLALLCLSSFVHAFERQDIEATTGALLIVGDWATTRNMSKRYNEGYYETGVLLNTVYGRRPSTNQVDLFFALRLLTHYAIYKSDLSPDTKSIYYYLTIGDHGYAFGNNLSIGLKVRF